MKKIVSALVVFALAFSMAACSNTPSKDVKLSEVYDKITAEVTLPAMIDLDSQTLMDQYGIDVADVNQGVYKQIEDFGAGKIDEILLLEAKDDEKAAAIKEKLDARIKSLVAQSEGYDAQAMEILDKSAVKQNGKFLILAVSKDAAKIIDIFSSNT